MAVALGLAFMENGWRVLFARTTDLLQKLQVARRELALEAAIDKHTACGLATSERSLSIYGCSGFHWPRPQKPAWDTPSVPEPSAATHSQSVQITAGLRDGGAKLLYQPKPSTLKSRLNI